jgi:hypothetical protein
VGGRRQSLAAVEALSVSPDGHLEPLRLRIARADLVPYSAARLRRMLGRNWSD